ncbi:LLM class flavin-dependent oxidoreductase [Microbacterium ulmi]|uniref:LLM class flavin-dependent oxidoreductase n=1 Tax=Microbacterium ulmi TaxID=179095 RepID=A0A7Y2PYA3_9MICO|nr:LLM class flavin-dependent oxidoreductase [Microbacterium ulmi]NII68349.1 5,10-methylenetetrahydromethanopterin reductase [Microbacterium ulmi]NNH03116.1 LLM class flavin-dependent oxidoreductase [Microbacterium ulmi]
MARDAARGAGADLTVGVGLLPRYDLAVFEDTVRRIDSDPLFSTIWVPDERFFRDLGVSLTIAAANSERVRLGSAVTDAFVRHPALTATLFASLDEYAGGRMVIGIGAGVAGLPAMGIARPRPQTAIREAIHLMRAMWKGGRVDFDGATTSFHGELDFAAPREAIPIWVAGRGPRILELAGAVADGALVGGLVAPAGLAFAEERILAGAASAGRGQGPTRAIWLHVGLDRDERRARDAVRPIVATVIYLSPDILQTLGIEMDRALLQELLAIEYSLDNPRLREVGGRFSDELLASFSTSGTPAQVAEGFRALREAGIEHIAVFPSLGEGQTITEFVELLAEATAGAQ